MTDIQAVIFDFGGVIVAGSGPNANGRHDDSLFGRTERRFGLAPGVLWQAHYENPTWHRLRVGEGTREGWLESIYEALLAHTDVASASAVLAALAEPRPPEFNEGMLELIGRLRRRLRVGLLSNAAPGLEDDLRERYGIYDLFHDVINSATVGLAKPDPRIYALASERIGVPIGRCFFTDDLPHNVEAAREAGMAAHQYEGTPGLVEALLQAGVDTG